MNWGKWIVVAFVLFTGFIATLVTVCMRQDVSLVSKDYYREELDYQAQIMRMNNTNQLHQKPMIEKSGAFVVVHFDKMEYVENGRLKLFSPADPTRDKTYLLGPNNGDSQSFATDDLARGMYRARMQWTMAGKEYYLETIIYI